MNVRKRKRPVHLSTRGGLHGGENRHLEVPKRRIESNYKDTGNSQTD